MDQIKAPATAYRNASTFRQRAALRLGNGFDGEFDIFGGELRMAFGKPGNGIGTGHHAHILARTIAPGYSTANLHGSTDPERFSLPRPFHREGQHWMLPREARRLFAHQNRCAPIGRARPTLPIRRAAFCLGRTSLGRCHFSTSDHSRSVIPGSDESMFSIAVTTRVSSCVASIFLKSFRMIGFAGSVKHKNSSSSPF